MENFPLEVTGRWLDEITEELRAVVSSTGIGNWIEWSLGTFAFPRIFAVIFESRAGAVVFEVTDGTGIIWSSVTGRRPDGGSSELTTAEEIADYLGVEIEVALSLRDGASAAVARGLECLGAESARRTLVETSSGKLVPAVPTLGGAAVDGFEASRVDRIGLGQESYTAHYDEACVLWAERADGGRSRLEPVEPGSGLYVLPGTEEVNYSVRQAALTAWSATQNSLGRPVSAADDGTSWPPVGLFHLGPRGRTVTYSTEDTVADERWTVEVEVNDTTPLAPRRVDLYRDGQLYAKRISVEAARHLVEACFVQRFSESLMNVAPGAVDEELLERTRRVMETAGALSTRVLVRDGSPCVAVGRAGEGRLIRLVDAGLVELSMPSGRVSWVSEQEAVRRLPSPKDRAVMDEVAVQRAVRGRMPRLVGDAMQLGPSPVVASFPAHPERGSRRVEPAL
ncbi:hypothetical protein BKH31_02805 [Actinomyces oris]|uniref:Uncharacterized protein n=1 Tax=Actinomyces oris TaxID=544580 RepID=A0A1Q8VJB1_9ACTO|nr:hypothetical protein [Actinomyces oris]OLO48175.1 hypothetical protein BKH31_02805 [Actinomyces oris]